MALALRFDVSRGIKNRYFNSAFLGYTVGLTVTIIVMNWFQAAQVSSVTKDSRHRVASFFPRETVRESLLYTDYFKQNELLYIHK